MDYTGIECKGYSDSEGSTSGLVLHRIWFGVTAVATVASFVRRYVLIRAHCVIVWQ